MQKRNVNFDFKRLGFHSRIKPPEMKNNRREIVLTAQKRIVPQTEPRFCHKPKITANKPRGVMKAQKISVAIVMLVFTGALISCAQKKPDKQDVDIDSILNNFPDTEIKFNGKSEPCRFKKCREFEGIYGKTSREYKIKVDNIAKDLELKTIGNWKWSGESYTKLFGNSGYLVSFVYRPGGNGTLISAVVYEHTYDTPKQAIREGY